MSSQDMKSYLCQPMSKEGYQPLRDGKEEQEVRVHLLTGTGQQADLFVSTAVVGNTFGYEIDHRLGSSRELDRCRHQCGMGIELLGFITIFRVPSFEIGDLHQLVDHFLGNGFLNLMTEFEMVTLL